MKIVIVGCGRVGASAAELWSEAGHDVIILDISTTAFERLSSTFKGAAIRGDGTDEDVLRRAGVEGADVFLALTEGDNRNVMASQLAAEAFQVPTVIAKINDPVRAAAYAELGIATLCRTGLMLDAVADYLDMPPSGLSGMQRPLGYHDAHHDDAATAAGVDASAAGVDASAPTMSGSGSGAASGAAREG